MSENKDFDLVGKMKEMKKKAKAKAKRAKRIASQDGFAGAAD